MTMFRACLLLSHVLFNWSLYKIDFISECGKAFHPNARYLRPISLSTVFIKTIERIIVVYTSRGLDTLSVVPHAVTKGKCIETVSHSLDGFSLVP